MPSISDVTNVIEAQNVGGERAQSGEDARVAADAAGVLGEATIADIVRAIFEVAGFVQTAFRSR